ncbi:MAG: hypothetical protein ABI132_01650 [Rhodanobacteraceae bacterium]
MNVMGYLALAGAGLCSAAASLLLKAAAISGTWPLPMRDLALSAGAIVVYGFGFLFYGVSLRTLPVGLAYASMVAICVIALFVYTASTGASPGLREWLGAAVIVLGVFLINWKGPVA